MKKYILIVFLLLIFTDYTISLAYNLPNNNFANYPVKNQYIKLQNNITKYYDETIKNLSTDNWKLFYEKIGKLSSLFIRLDENITNKNRTEAGYTITEIKKEVSDIIYFLKKSKQNGNIPPEVVKNNIISNGDNSFQPQIPLNTYSLKSNYGELMYYADSFEGGKTSNGNLFSHSYFSAAKCNVDLNKLIQVWLGNKSLIVKVNDRPSCERFPNLIDMPTTAFDYFYDRYKGKQKGEYIELGFSAKDYYKMYFPINKFDDEGIILQEKIPNSYLLNESIHINGELTLPGREISLKLISPSGKNITLTKQVDKYFSFSYPLEELGEYLVNFEGSSEKFKIYVLDDKLFNGKKFITQEIPKITNLDIIKDPLSKEVNAYRIVLKGGNYNSAIIKIYGKTYYYSGIGDIIIPEYILANVSEINIKISSSKTLTNFSHDFYTEPIVIFEGSTTISK